MSSIYRNRANGKLREGELVKVLRTTGIYARLGRSNEEGDVILPDLNIILEVKSTSRKNFRLSMNQKTKDQFYRLLQIPSRVFYAIRYKGNGLRNWRFHPIPPYIQILYKKEGLTLNEFVISFSLCKVEGVPA